MKKILTISILLLLLGNFIYAQGKIKQSEFQEKGFVLNLQLMETQKVTFTSDNIKIYTIPIDPISLNESLANAYYLSGEYNYTYIEKSRKDYFLKRDRKRGPSPEQTNPVLLNIGLDWLMDNDLIDESDYSKLSEEIQLDFTQKEDGSNTFERATGSFNPFNIAGRYLSIFKTTLVNNTNTPIKFSNRIEIVSNENILKPLSQTEIISMLKASNSFNVPKMSNLYRYNLDSNLIVPANSSTFKYFATLPIDNSSNSFDIVFNDKDTQTSKWEIRKTKQEINNKYTFYELEVYPTSWTYENIYVIIRNSNVNAYVASSKLFVDKDNIDKELSIFVYAIYEKKLFYFPLKFVPHKYLDLEKKRRERLPIDLIPIKL